MSKWPLDVDVVIAVHTPTRPVERAVRSVLDHTKDARIRVTVVAHNTDPAAVKARLAEALLDPRLRVVTHRDSFSTPAGPKNLGLELATAEFVAMLDSDDTLEPRALDAWFAAAKSVAGGADAVIAPTTTPTGGIHPSPPVRWHRLRTSGSSLLDPWSDRLMYRSSPLGLIGRERFAHLRFAEGIPTGEDQPVTAEMWFTPKARIIFPAFAPRYLEHHDQEDRVTATSRTVSAEFRSLDYTLAPGTPWSGTKRARTAIATKLIRVHLFDALRIRVGTSWSRQDAVELAGVAERILKWAPQSEYLLGSADTTLLNLVRDSSVDVARLRAQLTRRQQLRSLGAILPRRFWLALHSQAPLRYHLAATILAHRVQTRSIFTS